MSYVGPDLCRDIIDAIFPNLGYWLVARMKPKRRLNGVAGDMEHDLSFKQLVNYQKLWIFSNSDLFKRRQTSKQFDGNWRYTQVSDADEWAEATRNELHPHTRC